MTAKIKRPPLLGWRLRICWRPLFSLFQFFEKWGVHPISGVGEVRRPKSDAGNSKLKTESSKFEFRNLKRIEVILHGILLRVSGFEFRILRRDDAVEFLRVGHWSWV